MPFGDWLTYWYENHSKPKIRPTTQETYESRIRLHIIPEIGDIPLNKLTQNDLQQFYGCLLYTSLYMGDEPVGPLQKVRLPHLSVLQVHRLLCPIIAHKDTFEKDILSIHPLTRYKCLRFFLTPDQNCVILARN